MSTTERKIRVLIVDDSVVMRRILSEVIASDPHLEVAGFAANGRIALAMFGQVSPDVVTLDIEMPVMDGLATLQAMRAAAYRTPVIMFSTLTERGAEATIDALALGASDYVTKPAVSGGYHVAHARIYEALIPKIKALCREKAPTVDPISPVLRFAARHRNLGDSVGVVAIGCSTGGPNALAQVLPNLSNDLAVPVLIVQHMPPTFTRFLAQRLSTLCPLPVLEAAGGEVLEPGKIYIAPGGYHLRACRSGTSVSLKIDQQPPENSCRPSVDVLFRSVAEAFAGRVLAVVLTGMGQDGLRGCEQLRQLGATILVQDEATSVVWGMPGFVAKAGLADVVAPISEIGARIVKRVNFFRPAVSATALAKATR